MSWFNFITLHYVEYINFLYFVCKLLVSNYLVYNFFSGRNCHTSKNMFHSVDNGIRDRCDAALDTLHRVRTSLTTVKGSRRFAAQKKKLGLDFGRAFLQNKRRSSSLPYSQGRKATTSYTHRFVCLSNITKKLYLGPIKKRIPF